MKLSALNTMASSGTRARNQRLGPTRARELSPAMIACLARSEALRSGSHGWLFTAENGGWEYPVFLAGAVVVQSLLGDGAYALGLGSRPAASARLAANH
jgi:hypothetical protein